MIADDKGREEKRAGRPTISRSKFEFKVSSLCKWEVGLVPFLQEAFRDKERYQARCPVRFSYQCQRTEFAVSSCALYALEL
ncbi:hypothetical protein SLE2022_073360 [Rubroshorea leprosula]